eukprot:scaffold294137_cov14-Tisochrysis_lutea.AAC.1
MTSRAGQTPAERQWDGAATDLTHLEPTRCALRADGSSWRARVTDFTPYLRRTSDRAGAYSPSGRGDRRSSTSV